MPADGLAIASLLCGVIGLAGTCMYGFGVVPTLAGFSFGVVPSIVGLICGMASKTKGGVRSGGVVCSSVAIAFFVLAIVLFLVGFGLMAIGAASGSGTNP